MVAAAVLLGSLVVGWTLHRSLSAQLAGRLAGVHHALILNSASPVTVLSHLNAGHLSAGGALELAGTFTTADQPVTATVPGTLWAFDSQTVWQGADDLRALNDGEAIINEQLARRIKAKTGDWVLARLDLAPMMPQAGLFATRTPTQTARVQRLLVRKIVPAGRWADFSLAASQLTPCNLFIHLDAGPSSTFAAINRIFFSTTPPQNLARSLHLDDIGVQWQDTSQGPQVHNRSFVFTDAEIAALRSAHLSRSELTAYLAEEISTLAGRVSYGMIVASDQQKLAPDEIILCDWVAADLKARIGEPVTLTTLLAHPDGTFAQESLRLKLRDILPANRGLLSRDVIADIEGITSAKRIDKWKAPFPVDLAQVTPRDDDYWQQYGPAPKAIIADALMQQFWHKSGFIGDRAVTTVQLNAAATPDQVVAALLPTLPEWQVIDLDQRAAAAGQGSADFTVLFVSLSMFLVIAALVIAITLARLAVDARSGEAGLLQALGLSHLLWLRLILAEQAIALGLGVIAGAGVGIIYASSLLRLFSAMAAGTWELPPIQIAVDWPTLVAVSVALILVVLLTAWWQARRLIHRETQGLLVAAGLNPAAGQHSRSTCRPSLTTRHLITRWNQSDRRRVRLAFLVFLTASAVLCGVLIYRDVGQGGAMGKTGPTGDFALRCSSPISYRYDLATPAGRANMGLAQDWPADARIYSIMVGGGAEGGCLNMARPGALQLAGLGPDFIARGGFELITATKQPNPWTLLEAPADGPIPAFGDEETMMWVEKHSVGDTFQMDVAGTPRSFRLVGLVRGGLFSGQLLISRDIFRRLLPGEPGYRWHFIDAASADLPAVQHSLAPLLDLGFALESPAWIIASVGQVQRLYMNMFLVLGGLGLLLGAVAGSAVLLRDTFKRRPELAILLATGLSQGQVARILTLAHVKPAAFGIVAGAVLALIGCLAIGIPTNPLPAALFCALAILFYLLLALIISRAAQPRDLAGELRTL